MSSVQPDLSIVIPAYNEAVTLPGNLAEVFAFLRKQSIRAEVIVVDDGSQDGTAGIVEGFRERHPRLRLIRNPHCGKAFAVRTGVEAARGEFIFQCDADLSMPISELPKLLEPLQSGLCDIAIGSRVRRYRFPWYRRIMSTVFHWIVAALAVKGVNDTQCGFKCYRGDTAHDLFRRALLYRTPDPVRGSAVTGFDVEILFLAQRMGYRIKEVPVEWYFAETSSVDPIKDSLRNLRDVIRIRLNGAHGRYRYSSAAKGEMRGPAPE